MAKKGASCGINKKVNKFHFDNVFFDNPQFYEQIILYQIGDLSCENGFEIGEHRQPCYEISCFASGTGVFCTDGCAYPVKQGGIYLSRPGEIHNGIADQVDPFRFFYAGFNFEDCQTEQGPLLHIRKMLDQVKNPAIEDRFNIQAPFIGIFNEMVNLNNYSSLMIKTYLYQILVLTYRNFFEGWEREYVPQYGSDPSRSIVYDVINYIDVNLYKVIDLSVIASELNYSYSYLSRVFSQETGLSIQEYFNKKRFEKAVELLKQAESSITEIALKLNYQSIHSFSRAFRKSFGISPTEYQLLCKKARNEQPDVKTG